MNTQTHTLEVSRIDATLVEQLSEAAVRSGDLQLAIQGFALTLRLRAATNSWESDPELMERRVSDRRTP